MKRISGGTTPTTSSTDKFTDGAAYVSGPHRTSSYDKAHGLVGAVAAVAALG